MHLGVGGPVPVWSVGMKDRFKEKTKLAKEKDKIGIQVSSNDKINRRELIDLSATQCCFYFYFTCPYITH